MNCFLIDFENVKSTGLKGVEHLVKNDDVYIFYSDYANSITFDVHHKMNQSTANIKFFKSGILGKNSLDFQLVSYLGYLIAQKKYKNYYVITGDRGFDCAISFWRDFFKQNQLVDLDIIRFYNIQDALDKKNVQTKSPLRKVTPTMQTAEVELQLRQLKAEKVIAEKNVLETDTTFEKNSNVTKPIINDVISEIKNNDISISISKDTPVEKNVDKVIKEVKESASSNVPDTQVFKNKPIFKNTSNIIQDMPSQQKTVVENKSVTKENIDNKANFKKNNKNSNKKNNPQNSNFQGQLIKDNQNINNNLVNPKEDSLKNVNPNSKKNNNPVKSNKNNQVNRGDKNKNHAPLQNQKVVASNEVIKQEVPKIAYTEPKKLPSQATTSEKILQPASQVKTDNAPTVQSKGFVFGKIDVFDDVTIIENIQKKTQKQPVAVLEQSKNNEEVKSLRKDEPIIKGIDLVEKIAPKKDVTKVVSTQEVKSNNNPKKDITKVVSTQEVKPNNNPKKDVTKVVSSEEVKPNNNPKKDVTKVVSSEEVKPNNNPKKDVTKVVSTQEVKPNNNPKKDVTKVVSSEEVKPNNNLKKDVTKRKVGRPRIKPIQDEKNIKPKNNKKFQHDLPKDKLNTLLEHISKFPNLKDYLDDDKVQICKIIAFSESKQEGYQAFMSYFGKRKGIETYKVIKQEYDALKSLFDNK